MTDTAVRPISLRARHFAGCDWAFTVTPAAPNATFVWDFGDGQSAGTLEPSATHTYTGGGDRHVTVSVSSPERREQTGAINIVVADCEEEPVRQPGPPSARTSSEILIVSTLLTLVGAVLGVVGAGVDVSQLWVSGAVITLAALVLFLVWASSRAATTPPLLKQTMRSVVFSILVLVAPVAAGIALFFSAVDAGTAASAAHVLQVAVGGVWLLAAIGKTRTPGSARAAVERLIDGPPRAIALIARVAVPVELALAVVLLLRLQAHAAAIASIVLFTLFATALGRLAIREALDGVPGSGGCGCFGDATDAAAARAPRTVPTDADTSAIPRAVARNLVFAILAVAAAFGA